MRGRLVALLEARAAARRMRIVAALGDMGVEAVVEGEDVRASGAGLMGRWWRDLGLRDAGRDRI
ncbi:MULTISPECIES: hypothetical protein [Sphingobium]|jgi:hypothetical protein|uniref:hypothetical protein n=1 Tax=Sphingobium TaxID=165695 RepID=UPI0018D51712|nr:MULTISPECIES: hypothetical protein [Sphingobium]